MILVDTSILINWLRGVDDENTATFDRLVLSNADIAFSVITYQEILQGAKSDKEYYKLQEYFSTHKILYLPQSLKFYNDTSFCYKALREKGVTIRSMADVFIAMTAIYNKAQLFHNDRDFEHIKSYRDDLTFYK